MNYFIIALFLFNTPNLLSDWVFDYCVEVDNKKSIIIKYEDYYNIIDNKDSTLRLIRINNDIRDSSILEANYDDYFLGFDIDSNNLIYNGFKYVSIYNLKNKLTSKLSNKNKPFRNIEINNGKITTSSADLSNVSCNNKTKTLVQTINLDAKTQELHSFPDPIGIDLSGFSPSKAISIFNNSIAIHDISTYNIKFYDYNYNFVDSINYLPNNWKQYEGEIPHYNCDPEIMKHYDKCWNIIDNYSRINLINTLNDSTLLITWRTGETLEDKRKITYSHDKWTKINNEWVVEKEIAFENNEKQDEFNLSKLNVKAYYYIKHGYLYIIKPFPIDLVKKYYGKNYSEFENEMNEFYIDNDLQYTCFIYKYVP